MLTAVHMEWTREKAFMENIKKTVHSMGNIYNPATVFLDRLVFPNVCLNQLFSIIIEIFFSPLWMLSLGGGLFTPQ